MNPLFCIGVKVQKSRYKVLNKSQGLPSYISHLQLVSPIVQGNIESVVQMTLCIIKRDFFIDD